MTRLLCALVPVALVAALVYPGHAPRAAVAAEPAPMPKAGKLEYNRDVRPILAENCFACHGPDSAARKKDLRLDQRDAAIAAKAIVPGKPDKSELVTRIHAAADEGLMPPAKSRKKL